MPKDDRADAPVKTKAVLIDAASMTVLWMDDAAAEDLPEALAGSYAGAPVETAVPLLSAMGAAGIVETARETGAARHAHANLVSTTQGSMTLVASAYPLPDGRLLLLIEHSWQPKHREAESSETRHPHRRAR